VVGDSGAGALDADLSVAIDRALKIPRAAALAHSKGFSWDAAVSQFEAAVADCLEATRQPRRRLLRRTGRAAAA
jgi:hypothetical protein